MSGLDTQLDAALQLMFADAPGSITINSGGRTAAEQAQIIANNWSRFNLPQGDQARWLADVQQYGPEDAGTRWESTFTNARRNSDGSPFRNWIALPGRSNHQRGLAADLGYESPELQQWAHDNAAQYGLNFRLGNEPWHVELAEGASPQSSSAGLLSSSRGPQRQSGEQMATRSNQQPMANQGISAAVGGQQEQRQGGIRGLLDMFRGGQQQDRQERPSMWANAPFGLDDEDRRARLAMALEGMTLNPNQQMIESLGRGITDRREAAQQEQGRNATAEWLRSQGRDDLAQLVVAGGLPGTQAMSLASSDAQRQASAGAPPQAISNAVANADFLGLSGEERTAYFRRTLGIDPEEGETPAGFQTLHMRALAAGHEVGSPGYTRMMEEGSAPSTTVNVGAGETAFERQSGEQSATRFGEIVDSGMAANRVLTELGQLEQSLAQSGSGVGSQFRLMAGRFGIETEGLSELQASQAIVNRIVTAQRQPGSGVMTDADARRFERSVPAIMNQPGGNELIMRTMRAVLEYDVRAANIAQQALDGVISRQEASSQMLELGDPLAGVRGHMAGQPVQPQGGGSSGASDLSDDELLMRYGGN